MRTLEIGKVKSNGNAPNTGAGLGVPASPAKGSPPAEKLQNPHFRGSAGVGLGVPGTPGTPLARTLPLALGKASSNSRAPDTGSDKVTTAAAHHATPKQM